jgi:hypothetical protein
MKTLSDWIEGYQLTEECNNSIFLEFTRLTDIVPFLKEHKDWVEQHKWGFGDRAHHYMWYLILQHMQTHTENARLLEIGVFKGQIISLWALLGRELRRKVTIHAVSPFKGNRPGLVLHFTKKTFFPSYRRRHSEGNLYRDEDYLSCNKNIFARFGLDFSQVVLHRGYSSDLKVKNEAAPYKYDVIYIDGDHSYDGCLNDIRAYAPLVKPGGFLVLDDASCFLPGTMYFKGHEAVSKACEKIPAIGFKNVLNIGHNRIFMKKIT